MRTTDRGRLVRAAAVATVLLGCALGTTVASDSPERASLVVRVGVLHVGDGSVRRDVAIAIEDGRIVALGPAAEAGAITHDLPSGVATPGWVDAATQLGLAGGAVEDARALTPDLRAADAFDPTARGLRRVARHGTTTLGLVPAPGNVAAGRASLAAVRGDRAAEVVGGDGPHTFAFMAPALRGDRVPATLAGVRALLSSAFRGERWTTAAENPLPETDSALARLRALEGGRALAWTDTARSAEVAVELLSARGLDPTLVGLRGAAGDADLVAATGRPCVVTALGMDDSVQLLRLPGELAARGVEVALSSGAPARSAGSLRMAVALAVANGFPADQAVQAVTQRPARALGAEGRIGRLAEGLEGDLVVFSGDPWEPASAVLLVVSDGRVVSEPEAAPTKKRGKRGKGKGKRRQGK